MKINKTVETGDGGVTFIGELVAEELDVVLSYGLHALLLRGLLPMKAMDPVNAMAGSNTEQ